MILEEQKKKNTECALISIKKFIEDAKKVNDTVYIFDILTDIKNKDENGLPLVYDMREDLDMTYIVKSIEEMDCRVSYSRSINTLEIYGWGF